MHSQSTPPHLDDRLEQVLLGDLILAAHNLLQDAGENLHKAEAQSPQHRKVILSQVG
jgi:hypothetical protein